MTRETPEQLMARRWMREVWVLVFENRHNAGKPASTRADLWCAWRETFEDRMGRLLLPLERERARRAFYAMLDELVKDGEICRDEAGRYTWVPYPPEEEDNDDD